jgi:hypothetical protein
MNKTWTFASLVTAGALLAAPAIGQAAKPVKAAKTHPTKSCKAMSVGYSIGGTLMSATLDDPATTAVNEGSITLKVTSANKAARNSGEIADQDAVKPGLQYKGATMTLAVADDAYTVRLNGYEAPDTPSVGDKVHVVGKIALTKKRCAPAGTSLADRYAAPNVRKVTISDRDADVVAPPPVA